RAGMREEPARARPDPCEPIVHVLEGERALLEPGQVLALLGDRVREGADPLLRFAKPGAGAVRVQPASLQTPAGGLLPAPGGLGPSGERRHVGVGLLALRLEPHGLRVEALDLLPEMPQ